MTIYLLTDQTQDTVVAYRSEATAKSEVLERLRHSKLFTGLQWSQDPANPNVQRSSCGLLSLQCLWVR